MHHKNEVTKIIHGIEVGKGNFSSGIRILNLMDDFADSKTEKLIQSYDKYIELLGEELDELMLIASIRGWKSSRIDEGKKARNIIEDIKDHVQPTT